MKDARQKLHNYYAEVPPTTGVLLISVHILDLFQKLHSFMKWDNTIDINPEDETSNTTQYQEDFLKYVGIEYFANHRRMSVINPKTVLHSNIFPSAKASEFGQSSFDSYDLSSDDEEYVMPKGVDEMTPGRSHRAARLLTAASLYVNSPPESPKNCGRVNPNRHDYHCDPVGISSTFCFPHIADWWRQQDEAHSKYADHSDVTCNIFSLMPHGVGMEASFSLGGDIPG